MSHDSVAQWVQIVLIATITACAISHCFAIFALKDATIDIKNSMENPSSMPALVSSQMAAVPDNVQAAALDGFMASALVQSNLNSPIECQPFVGTGCPYGTCVCEYYSPAGSRACPVNGNCQSFARACGSFGAVCDARAGSGR